MKKIQFADVMNFKSFFVLFSILFISIHSCYSQQDTIRLHYQGTQTKLLDSSEAKIDKWVKNLKGRKADVKIVGYYEKSEFKDVAKARLEDIQMVIIRKARETVTIKKLGTDKGPKAKRTCVEIIATVYASEAELEAKAKAEEEAKAKEEAAKKVMEEKASASSLEQPKVEETKEEPKKMEETPKEEKPQ
jgi:hypothetical protein